MTRILLLAVLATLALASRASAALVIIEVVYDQASTDTAEFAEIRNGGSAPVDLDPYALRLVNGANGGAAIYKTIDLPAVSLAAGDSFVVCGGTVSTTSGTRCTICPTSSCSETTTSYAPSPTPAFHGTACAPAGSVPANTGASGTPAR